MRVALDTNIVVYAEGLNGPHKMQQAIELLEKLPPDRIVTPAQVLGELFNVLVKKARRSSAEARTAILSWHDSYEIADTSAKVILAATELASQHKLGIWDAVILATAADAGCRLLLSEDMQDGFTWNGVTVANPFAAAPHPLLDAILKSSP